MPYPRLAPALTLAVAALGASCGSATAPPPARNCATFLWARPETASAAPLSVMGSWNGWASPGAPLVAYGGGWQVLPLSLPPGEYGYQVVEAGAARVDPFNPLTTFHGDTEVSLLTVDDCSVPAIRVDSVSPAAVSGVFLTAASGERLDPASLRVKDSDGSSIPVQASNASDGTFSLSTSALAPGKHTLSIAASDSKGVVASPARAVVWEKPAMESWAEGVLYQIMIDRYRGDGGVKLAPPATPGSRAGGTLGGVLAEINKGTFEELGVTALWLSPVYVNPTEPRIGRDGHVYEGYHGYWPEEERSVDPRIGGDEALRAVIAAAHQRGLRVILDLVPNHVYETNPRYLAHTGDGWYNDGPDKCVCGDPGCGWGDHLLTCWFSPYLPDVRWQEAESLNAAVDDARFWTTSFDADGVRIDAVPMMPRAATRRIARALRTEAAPAGALFSIGEVYTGAGSGGIDTIKYFLGPDGLDGAFDFPLMWTIRDAVAADRAGLDAVEEVLASGEAALKGSGAVMGKILDNHDTSRFISEASGEGALDPWNDPPAQPEDPALYARQKLALGLLFTLPGLPVLYYGDEVALAGAGDPDSRRVMPALDAISAEQQGVRDQVKRLGKLRRCSKALRTGARVPLVATAETYAHLRDAGDGSPAITLMARKASKVVIPTGKVPPGDYVDALSGAAVSVNDGATISLEALSLKVLIPASSPCR